MMTHRQKVRGVLSGFVLSLGLLTASGAFAADKLSNAVFIPSSHKLSAGQLAEMRIDYTGDQNNTPVDAYVQLITPGGAKVKVPIQVPTSPPSNNVWQLSATTKPTDGGTYQYYYFVRDAEGINQYPEGQALTFQVQPNWFPWAIMAGGFVLSLIIVTTLVYQVMSRGLRSSQTSSARVALFVGCLCWMVCILYAWDWLTSPIAWIIGVVALLIIGASAFFAR